MAGTVDNAVPREMAFKRFNGVAVIYTAFYDYTEEIQLASEIFYGRNHNWQHALTMKQFALKN